MRGARVLILRPEEQAEELAELIASYGGDPVVVPAVAIAVPERWDAIDTALAREFEWGVFTSVNGVRIVLARAEETGATLRCARMAAIGPGTHAALRARGVPVDWVPSDFTTEAIGEGLPGPPAGVCLFRADAADERLDARLRARGFDVVRVDAYRTQPVNRDAIARTVATGIDVVLLTSASIARAFADASGEQMRTHPRPLVCTIGPATSEACRNAGLPVDAQAATHTIAGLAQAAATLLGDSA